MAGVKGRSGGARPNAGRKAKPVKPLKANAEDPVEFLLQVMLDPDADPKLRVRAAVSAAQYRHSKKGDAGKREEQAKAAKQAGSGRYAPSAPPRLVVDNKDAAA